VTELNWAKEYINSQTDMTKSKCITWVYCTSLSGVN